MDVKKLKLAKQIENVFQNLAIGKINDNQAEVLLSKLASQIVNTKIFIPVRIIYDSDYVDIFTRIEVGDTYSDSSYARIPDRDDIFKDITFVIRPVEIIINKRLLSIYSPKELTAAFLYEIGLYENLIHSKDGGLQALAVFGFSFPAKTFALFSSLYFIIFFIGKYTGKYEFKDTKSVLISSVLLSLITAYLYGLIAYLITITKYRYTSRYSYKYVVQLGYSDYLKEFIQKHKRVSHPYGMKYFKTLGAVFGKVIRSIAKVLMYAFKSGDVEQLTQLCDLRAEMIEYATRLETKGVDLKSIQNDLEYLRKVCKGYLGPGEIRRLERLYNAKLKHAMNDIKKFMK